MDTEPTDHFLEKPTEKEVEFSDLVQDSTIAEVDQALSEDQKDRETMRIIRS